MIVQCAKCKLHFDDQFRFTFCPHKTFSANDGRNNFKHHTKSYLEGDSKTDKKYKAALHLVGKSRY